MTSRSPFLIVLLFVWAVMAAVFVTVLPHVEIDRVSESWAEYFKRPYQMIEQGHLRIPHADPFPENGPHAVYPPAAIAYWTGSLWLTRAYQFAFSMVVVGLLLYYFISRFREQTFKNWEIAAYGIISAAAWISIPLALVYPLQINGMTGGFACLLLGIMLYPRSRAWGMFCFGWAFSFKGQYLAFLPGFMIYLFFFDIRTASVWKHLIQSIGALAMFFVPKSVILSSLFGLLGMFDTQQEFLLYAFDGPYLIAHEFRYIVGRILGQPSAAAPEAAIRRALEYSGFGILAWGHIAMSVGFCSLIAFQTLWKRIRTRIGDEWMIDNGLAMFGWGGLFYWINYLCFYRFPYWYNVFAVVFMNIYLVAAGLRVAVNWLVKKRGKLWGGFLTAEAAVVAVMLFLLQWHRALEQPRGNAITPYEWMRAF